MKKVILGLLALTTLSCHKTQTVAPEHVIKITVQFGLGNPYANFNTGVYQYVKGYTHPLELVAPTTYNLLDSTNIANPNITVNANVGDSVVVDCQGFLYTNPVQHSAATIYITDNGNLVASDSGRQALIVGYKVK